MTKELQEDLMLCAKIVSRMNDMIARDNQGKQDGPTPSDKVFFVRTGHWDRRLAGAAVDGHVLLVYIEDDCDDDTLEDVIWTVSEHRDVYAYYGRNVCCGYWEFTELARGFLDAGIMMPPPDFS